MQVTERIAALRDRMAKKGLDAYILTNTDPHLSEYVASHWKVRQWISGFSGSAGTVVITRDKAGLWTDGRYYIQAETQLAGSGIDLFRAVDPGVPTYGEWLRATLAENSRVGLDGRVFSVEAVRSLEKDFSGKQIRIETADDPVAELWADRPAAPTAPVGDFATQYAGKSRQEKLGEVQAAMTARNVEYFLLTALDDIAWLFNLRGTDVPNNPVFAAYALIGRQDVRLFIAGDRLEDSLRRELAADGIALADYGAVADAVRAIRPPARVLLDASRVSIGLYKCLAESVEKLEDINITTRLKAVKNPVEIENLKRCYIKDGVALTKFLCWLDQAVGTEQVTEFSADAKLQAFRSEQPLNQGPSFDTIAGYRDHGAIMHYSATQESAYTLERNGLFLLDSGGQYLDGTTDVTRTVALGRPTAQEMRDFTLVLKAVIGLSTAKFLYGAHGCNLDILARKPLWEAGIDYKCGTGHGIGFFLNVHEGPHSISMRPIPVKLEPGMIATNEPGVYREGVHGIRTENTLLVIEDEKTEFGQFLRFETISPYPIDSDVVDVAMLSADERQWLNNYNRKVYEQLSPHLSDAEAQWLRRKTREL